MIPFIRKQLGEGKARLFSFLYWMAFGLAIAIVSFGLLLAGTTHLSLASTSPWPVRADGLPDFNKVTPDNFAVFSKDQCFKTPASAAHLVEGDQLCVKAGDKFSSLPVSILNTFSQIGTETVTQLLANSGLSPDEVRLDQLPFIDKASAEELFQSLDLSGKRVSEVLKQELAALNINVYFDGDYGLYTNQQVFDAFPNIAKNPLKHVGDLSVSSLEGLDSTPLNSVAKALAQPIDRYPGLKDRVFSSFPQPPSLPAIPTFAKADKVRIKENLSTRISTGSLQERSIPCNDTSKCNGFEFSELIKGTLVGGTIAVSGDSQETNSGFGFLGGLNIGREPTGDFPLGEIFKESYHNFRADGKADRAMNFRICDRGGFLRPDLGCTKYFIGPIVYGQLSENGHETLLLGNPQFSTAALIPKTPAKPDFSSVAFPDTVATVDPVPVFSGTTNTPIGGVNVDKLSIAIKNTGFNVDKTELQSLLISASTNNPTLNPATLIQKVAVSVFAGIGQADTSATNPVSGDSVQDFADKVATAYAEAQ